MRIGSVREEVVALGWPSYVRVVQGFQVAGWRGVEDVHIGTVGLFGVGVSTTKH